MLIAYKAYISINAKILRGAGSTQLNSTLPSFDCL